MKNLRMLCSILMVAGAIAVPAQYIQRLVPPTYIMDNLRGEQFRTNPQIGRPLYVNPANTFGGDWRDPAYGTSNLVPKSNESFEISMSGTKLQVAWIGNSDFLSGAYVAILDKAKKELSRQRFETMPITYSVDIPKGGKWVRLVMTYVNGSVTSLTSPIPAPEPAPAKSEPDKPAPKDTNGLGGP